VFTKNGVTVTVTNTGVASTSLPDGYYTIKLVGNIDELVRIDEKFIPDSVKAPAPISITGHNMINQERAMEIYRAWLAGANVHYIAIGTLDTGGTGYVSKVISFNVAAEDSSGNTVKLVPVYMQDTAIKTITNWHEGSFAMSEIYQ
jgi:hypothetical protein